jgi:hypothetical protein
VTIGQYLRPSQFDRGRLQDVQYCRRGARSMLDYRRGIVDEPLCRLLHLGHRPGQPQTASVGGPDGCRFGRVVRQLGGLLTMAQNGSRLRPAG